MMGHLATMDPGLRGAIMVRGAGTVTLSMAWKDWRASFFTQTGSKKKKKKGNKTSAPQSKVDSRLTSAAVNHVEGAGSEELNNRIGSRFRMHVALRSVERMAFKTICF